MTILVTGGLGFIGRNFIINWNSTNSEKIICVDSNRLNKSSVHIDIVRKECEFYDISIGNRNEIKKLLKQHTPRAVINFAAESHVDFSISKPADTYANNVTETANFLEEVKDFHVKINSNNNFQFLQVSTDEVYGSADLDQEPFIETDLLKPTNPYSASKAACEHMVQAFSNTYGMPFKITRCSNNFGPYQNYDKFIPTVINSFLKKKNVPIYGDGLQIRDWLFVTDHVEALTKILDLNETNLCLNIGAQNELTNIDVVKRIASIFDEILPQKTGSYSKMIKLVNDRPGHDRRYAINTSKLKSLIEWSPKQSFQEALMHTVVHFVSEVVCND